MLVGLVALLQPDARPVPLRTASSLQEAALPTVAEADLLLYSLELQQLTLSDGLGAYGDPDDPLLPVGELARLLDLDVDVAPSEYRISGTLGESRRPLIVDLRAKVARLEGRAISLATSDIATSLGEIYIRASTLSKLFSVRFDVDGEALAVRILPTEKLPIQLRMERLARLRASGERVDQQDENSIAINSPYELISAPSVDITFEAGRDSRTLQSFSRRYDVRVAGDLLYANLQGYVGADDAGRPQTARFLLERRSAHGRLPLGATRISAGDVFAPALAMGLRSVGGRGISFTTAALEEESVFDTIDLRGELPIGFDVELYVNDVLRSGARTPVGGRYEFLDVPLVRGVNVIRLVSYGPRGERSDTVRVVNVGGGQLRTQELQIDVGLIEKGRDLVGFHRSLIDESPDLKDIGPRLVGTVAYGLSDALTITAGAAVLGRSVGNKRALGTVGVRSSAAGLAFRADAAADARGRLAFGVGAAGQPFGIPMVFEHLEYRSGFVDETVTATDANRPRARHSAVTLDLALPPIGGRRIPLTVRANRDKFVDGTTSWVASARASATIIDTLVSTGLDYQRTSLERGQKDERLTGNVAASRFLKLKWQLRSAVDYDLKPKAMIRALSITADRNISERVSLRLGIGQTLGESRETFGQIGTLYRLPFGEFIGSADYSLEKRDWRLSVRFGFGSVFNPLTGKYAMTPPGAASGGSAAFRAFVDRDGDGRFGVGDEPVRNVAVHGGSNNVATDGNGHALLTGLGTAPSALLNVSTRDTAQSISANAPARVRVEPRPGKVIEIPYAVAPVGAVYARFVTVDSAGRRVGIAALQTRLLKAGHDAIRGITEYDGSVFFSDVPLGVYQLELEPSQAQRLEMRLRKPIVIEVKADSDVEVEGTLEFDSK